MKIREPVHIFSWEPSRIDWWSTLIQLVGTLFFNFSTFASIGIIFLFNKMVWTPDLFGSVCFLIASFLAWSEANHSLWSWNIKSLSWWISLFNLLGSVAFGISAIGAYISPTTNLTLDPFIMNLGTFIGAICFFIGALLLLPERTSDLLNLEGLNFEKYLKDGHNILKL
jgi:hypothetical protein